MTHTHEDHYGHTHTHSHEGHSISGDGVYQLQKFTLDTLSALGTDDDEFEAMSCTPNCNPKQGNPPFVTVSLALIYLIVFLATPNVTTRHNEMKAAAEVKVLQQMSLNVLPINPHLFKKYAMYNVTDYVKQVRHNLIHEEYGIKFEEQMQNYRDPASFIPNKRQEIYRYWTYQFYHTSTETFVINILLLLIAGVFLELVQDWWRVLLIHTIGVIFAAMWSYIALPSILVGASGGIYAIIFAHFTNLVLNSDNLDRLPTRIIVRLPIVALMLYDYCVTTRSGRGATAGAHIAGAFVGICLAASIMRNFIVNTWETWTIRICNILLILATVIAFGQQFKAPQFGAMQHVNGAGALLSDYNTIVADGGDALFTLFSNADTVKIYCTTGHKIVYVPKSSIEISGYWSTVKDYCYNDDNVLIDSDGNTVYGGCSLSDSDVNGCNGELAYGLTGVCNLHDACYTVQADPEDCDIWMYYNLASLCTIHSSTPGACHDAGLALTNTLISGGRSYDSSVLPYACSGN